jgi:MFS transporter, DHA2 family, multidrug resistance protein
VFGAGLVMMPRGLGSFVAMFVVGQLVGRVDTRLILFVGLSLCSLSLWQMSHFSLTMDSTPFITSGIIQGLGIGLLFVPLSVTAFATLAPALRSEGTSVYTLIRNLGSSVGISLMQAFDTRQTAVSHSDMAAQLQPGNPVVAPMLPPGGGSDMGSMLDSLNNEITRQASMVGLVDVFRLMLLLTFMVAPLLLFMRKPKAPAGPAEVIVD